MCGSATNAFLNLLRSAGLETRRLLLLTPEHTAKHVVVEVHLDGRWVIVDSSYRLLMKDARGNLLTRKDLQNLETLREATSSLPHYPPEYTYERFAHARLASSPFHGAGLREFLDLFFPVWEDYSNWNLLLERRSFLYFFISATSLIFLVWARTVLAWMADHYLQVPRFHFLAGLGRATISSFGSRRLTGTWGWNWVFAHATSAETQIRMRSMTGAMPQPTRDGDTFLLQDLRDDGLHFCATDR
ncbi:MAG: hypothetical protein ACHQT6_00920 [Candidatus Acidiferrales bacterium]